YDRPEDRGGRQILIIGRFQFWQDVSPHCLVIMKEFKQLYFRHRRFHCRRLIVVFVASPARGPSTDPWRIECHNSRRNVASPILSESMAMSKYSRFCKRLRTT